MHSYKFRPVGQSSFHVAQMLLISRLALIVITHVLMKYRKNYWIKINDRVAMVTGYIRDKTIFKNLFFYCHKSKGYKSSEV